MGRLQIHMMWCNQLEDIVNKNLFLVKPVKQLDVSYPTDLPIIYLVNPELSPNL